MAAMRSVAKSLWSRALVVTVSSDDVGNVVAVMVMVLCGARYSPNTSGVPAVPARRPTGGTRRRRRAAVPGQRRRRRPRLRVGALSVDAGRSARPPTQRDAARLRRRRGASPPRRRRRRLPRLRAHPPTAASRHHRPQPRPVTWCGVTWCAVTWCGVTWRAVTWCEATWYGVTWRGVTWCEVTWSEVTWCGATCGRRGDGVCGACARATRVRVGARRRCGLLVSALLCRPVFVSETERVEVTIMTSSRTNNEDPAYFLLRYSGSCRVLLTCPALFTREIE